MVAEQSRPPVPMDQIVANELELYGSHGIQAYRYSELLQMIADGKLEPQKLLGRTVNLEEGVRYLTAMDSFEGVGVTVIDRF
jgi:alcohol dehydrogenase